jgi:hypothetical protein
LYQIASAMANSTLSLRHCLLTKKVAVIDELLYC